MKSRQFFLVEAFVEFRIDQEIECDDTYVFPEHQLLLNARHEQMRSIKDIFRKEARSETLKMSFTPAKLMFSGTIN
jgi:hypothetical protein